jgi:hypothetical protein
MQKNSTPDYAQAIKEATQAFNELLPTDQWNLDSDKNGLKVYTRKDQATGLKMARGESVINSSPAKVDEALEDPKAVLKWDDTLVENDKLEQSGEYRLIRSLNKKQFMVTQRETLMVFQTVKNADGSIFIVGRSVEHPTYPAKKDYVRANIPVYGWLLKPSKEDPNKTEVIYIIFVDPKGMIPSGVFNSFVQEQAANAQKIKNYVEKQ